MTPGDQLSNDCNHTVCKVGGRGSRACSDVVHGLGAKPLVVIERHSNDYLGEPVPQETFTHSHPS